MYQTTTDILLNSPGQEQQSASDLSRRGFQARNGSIYACNGSGFKNILAAGQQWLRRRVQHVDRLNVFPVPDGDTGTNMLLTMQAALKEMERSTGQRVETVAAAAAQGALMGARGNSGVILSQFLSGLAAGLKGLAGFTARDFTNAMKLGVDQAYQGVINPVEGTILTVLYAMSEAANHSIKNNSDDLVGLFSDIVGAGQMALSKTPELLPALKEAGVIDSGGQGLLYILEGGLRFMRHEPLDLKPIDAIMSPLGLTVAKAGKETYGYDVQFLLYGQQLQLAKIRADINAMGQSALVVGDRQLVKVHVHVPDPEPPLRYGMQLGLVADLLIDDMGAQVKAFADQGAATSATSVNGNSNGAVEAREFELISIVPGYGLASIFKSLGADHVVLRDKAVPASLEVWRNYFDRLQAEQLLVLPDDSQTAAMLRQIQDLANKQIRVAAVRTAPEGIAALLAFDRQRDLDENIRRMSCAARQLYTMELLPVSPPPGQASLPGKAANLIAYVEDEGISSGTDYPGVLLEALSQVEVDSYELMTIYFGQDRSQDQADKLADRVRSVYAELEVEVYNGAQSHCHYIISLE